MLTLTGGALLRQQLRQPMPLGFGVHPVGMVENSPALQRWAPGNKTSGVPEGRLMQRIVSAVPSGRNRSGLGFPTLKRWAILIGPFETKNSFELTSSNPSGIG